MGERGRLTKQQLGGTYSIMINIERQHLQLPFDLYTRNLIVSSMLNAVRKDGPLKILDVGGSSRRLKMFLHPGDEVHILDHRENENGEENYHQGEICAAPFRDQEFDVVVSSDVYEHIPSAKRERAFLEMLRISKGIVILGCSFNSPFVAEVKQRTCEFFKVLMGKEHILLCEHHTNGLPDPEDFEILLKRTGCTYTFIAHNNLFNWLLLQGFTFCAHASGMSQEKVNAIYTWYNKHFDVLGDFLPPSYRRTYLISRSQIIPSLPYPEVPLVDDELLRKFWSDVLGLIIEQAMKINRKELPSMLREFMESTFQGPPSLLKSAPSVLFSAVLKGIQDLREAEVHMLRSIIEEKDGELQDVLFKLAAIHTL